MGKGRDYADRGRWTEQGIFKLAVLQEAAGAGTFDTSQIKTDTPTLFGTANYASLWQGMLRRIHYRIKPANAVTYILRLWEAPIANDYESNSRMLYESPALQAGDTDYDREVNIPFVLGVMGRIYYSLEWTGATGNVQGFIVLSGEVYR